MMKKFFTLFVLLLISVISFAQSPKLNFQAVMRDSENKLVVEQPVTVTVNVLDADNASQFEQTLHATTNRNGLMSLEIGDETAAWSNINWEGAKIRTAVAFNGTEAVDTTVVNAVPLALYASSMDSKVIQQSDWAETDYDTCTFILNKPSIADTVNNILTADDYITTAMMDARGYLTADSTAIITLQGNIATNATNIATNANNIAAAVSKEKADSTTLATRLDALESSSLNCNVVKACIKDTLNKYTTTEQLCNAVNNCDLSGNTSLQNMLRELSGKISATNSRIGTLGNRIDSIIPSLSVTTDSATHIGSAYAMLHGTVTSLGDKTSVTAGFVYGTAQNALTHTVSESTSVTGDFLFNILHLESNTTYYYKAFETDGTDTVYGEVKNFTTTSFTCGIDSVSDHEGNLYATVQIGTQCWTQQNMRCTTAPDGTVTLTKGNGNRSTSTPYYYVPTSDMTVSENIYDSTDYVKKFGLLYNFPGAMAINNTATTLEPYHRGICPEGWHVPTDGEWTTMATFVYNSTDPVYKCDGCSGGYGSGEFHCIAKALADSTDWNGDGSSCAIGNNRSNNNATGFSALPAGSYYNDYGGLGVNAYYWSATPAIDERALEWHLFFDSDLLDGSVIKRHYGQSVRCVHNPLIFSTDSASSITYHSVTLHGTATFFDENFDSVTVGFLYGTSASALNKKVSAGTISESNTFSLDCSNLSGNTTYYYQAFGTNGTDSLWGTVMNFTTADSISVTTNDTTHTTPTTVTLQGTINELGGYASLTVGFQYGTSESAMESRVAAGTMSTTGTFDYELTLTAATVYYQAFAANEEDTVLGDVKFFTPIAPMSVTTDSATHIGSASAILHGTINGLSNPNATTAGFVYGTAENALTNNVAKSIDITSDYNCPVQNLIPLTTYYYKAFETDGVDTVYGEVKDFTTTFFTCDIDSVADHEGNLYATVKIGFQCWTKQNMRCQSAPEGTVNLLKGDGKIFYDSIPHYYEPIFYNNKITVNGTTYSREEYIVNYGFLYNYPAAMAINHKNRMFDIYHRGICPEGWHVPSDEEWLKMAEFITNSTDPNYKCSECSDQPNCIAKALAATTDWKESSTICAVGNNLSANNATGFSALPAGRNIGKDIGSVSYFWTSTALNKDCALLYSIQYDRPNFSYFDYNTRDNGYSVRCLHNPMTVATDSVSVITNSSVILHGTVKSLDENDSVAVGFRYGYSRNEMESTVTVGKVAEIGSFSFDIDGLDTITLYYRAFAVNSEDTIWGKMKLFTPIATMSVTTDSVSHIHHRSAMLHGSLNGLSTPNATTAGFIYGTAENALTDTTMKSVNRTGEYNCYVQNLATLTTYYYKAFETDGVDTVWGNNVMSFTTTTFVCVYDTVADHEGNLYTTVQIGTQCWTQQNMRCKSDPAGRVLLEKGNGYHSFTQPYYYEPAGNMTVSGNIYSKEEYVEKFGLLYNYPAAMAIDNDTTAFDYPHRGICPEGWHIPIYEEWENMVHFVYNSTDPDYKCPGCSDFSFCISKALAATTDWAANDDNCAVGNDLPANNATGFSMLPTGVFVEGYLDSAGDCFTYFISADSNNKDINYGWSLEYSGYLSPYYYYRCYGQSVRCLKD